MYSFIECSAVISRIVENNREMVMKFLYRLCLLLGFSFSCFGETIEIVTEQYPPYNYLEDDKVKGISTDVIRAVLKEANIEGDFRVLPWARAQKIAQSKKDVLIYSISRTEAREKLYKWVGVIAPIDFYIFTRKDRLDIQFENLEDAKHLSIGVVIQDAQEQFFKKNGFTNIQSNVSNEANMKKLMKGRFDLWPISELAGYYYLRSNGYVPKESVKKAYHLEGFANGDQYMAFSISTSDALVNKVKLALAAIKTKGVYQKILDQHMQ